MEWVAQWVREQLGPTEVVASATSAGGATRELQRSGQVDRTLLLEFFDRGDALLAKPGKHSAMARQPNVGSICGGGAQL